MPKEELNLEDINLFDPNNVDHAMALFICVYDLRSHTTLH